MIPFGKLYKLLNLCLQTIIEDILCIHCLRNLDFNLRPQHSLEQIFFNHPEAKFYSISATLRLVIQKQIFLVYNILFFLEEVLEQVGNNPHKELKACILRLLCDLRQAKLFPTVEALSESTAKRSNHR